MQLGKLGEDLARRHYEELGYRLLDQNYIFRHGRQSGEIDLVLIKNRELVFVEVKTRTSQKFGTAFESVDFFKQAKLVRTVKLYLLQHPKYQNYLYRIDVAAVDVDNREEPVIILMNAVEDSD